MNILKKILKNTRGSVLIQAMAVLGVIGLGTAGVMQLNKDSAEAIKFTEGIEEEREFVKQIKLALMQPEACARSFTNINSTSNIIRSTTGTGVFTVNSLYGGGAIRLTGLQMVRLTPIDGSGNTTGELRISISRIKTNNTGTANMTNVTKVQAIPIKARVAGSGAINFAAGNFCHTDISTDLGTSLQDNCVAMGGTYTATPAPGNCDLSCVASPGGNAVSGNCLDNMKGTALISPNYDNTFLPQTGGVMNGNLVVTGDVTANEIASGNQICTRVSGNLVCRDFTAKNCPDGQVVTGINPNGSLNCMSIDCGVDQYFEGVNASGQRVCNDLPDDNCPAGQVITRVNGDGSVQCAVASGERGVVACPAGQYLASIDSNGNRTCRSDDRVSSRTCSSGQAMIGVTGSTMNCTAVVDRNAFGSACPSGQYLRGYSSTGGAVCSSGCSPNWAPSTSTQCSGVSFTQSDGCGGTRIRTGTSTTGSCTLTPGCWANEVPANVDCGSTTLCHGAGYQNNTGISGTGTTLSSILSAVDGEACPNIGDFGRVGVRYGYAEFNCAACAPACTPNWTPAPSTQCNGVSFTQTDSNNCASTGPSHTQGAVGTSTTGACAASCPSGQTSRWQPTALAGPPSDTECRNNYNSYPNGQRNTACSVPGQNGCVYQLRHAPPYTPLIWGNGICECRASTCTPSWTPAPSTQCNGVSFTQTDSNSCASTGPSHQRPATGTSTTGSCAPSGCWQSTAAPVTVSGSGWHCGGMTPVYITSNVSGSSCGTTSNVVQGSTCSSIGATCIQDKVYDTCSPPKTPGAIPDRQKTLRRTYSCNTSCGCTPSCPSASNVCLGTTHTGPNGCGGTCSVVGSQTSGTDVDGQTCAPTCTPNWTPDPILTCPGSLVPQTDGCGNSRSVDGTRPLGCGGGPVECIIFGCGSPGCIPHARLISCLAPGVCTQQNPPHHNGGCF